MADEYAYENLPVNIRRKGDYYEIGTEIHGAFLAFGQFKAGGFDEDLREGQEAGTPATVDRHADSLADLSTRVASLERSQALAQTPTPAPTPSEPSPPATPNGEPQGGTTPQGDTGTETPPAQG